MLCRRGRPSLLIFLGRLGFTSNPAPDTGAGMDFSRFPSLLFGRENFCSARRCAAILLPLPGRFSNHFLADSCSRWLASLSNGASYPAGFLFNAAFRASHGHCSGCGLHWVLLALFDLSCLFSAACVPYPNPIPPLKAGRRWNESGNRTKLKAPISPALCPITQLSMPVPPLPASYASSLLPPHLSTAMITGIPKIGK